MEREDLLNALRLVRDYCGTISYCDSCCIEKECNMIAKTALKEAIPEDWDLDEDV